MQGSAVRTIPPAISGPHSGPYRYLWFTSGMHIIIVQYQASRNWPRSNRTGVVRPSRGGYTGPTDWLRRLAKVTYPTLAHGTLVS
jgi:hypothetical protein